MIKSIHQLGKSALALQDHAPTSIYALNITAPGYQSLVEVMIDADPLRHHYLSMWFHDVGGIIPFFYSLSSVLVVNMTEGSTTHVLFPGYLSL